MYRVEYRAYFPSPGQKPRERENFKVSMLTLCSTLRRENICFLVFVSVSSCFSSCSGDGHAIVGFQDGSLKSVVHELVCR
jgi:hypothetical protein